ncbi:oligosaccharyltransferase complex subunit epsilon [Microbotryomycetes sp. JL221]|nr:oligosaccharyltransferase complex subunit epsilon [Microbotryomycetes sp. JL221]
MPSKQRTPAKPPSSAVKQAPTTTTATQDTATKTSVGAVSAAYTHNNQQPGNVFSGSLQQLWTNYNRDTSNKLKLCDGLQLFLMLTGIAQFAYCILITNYPFNAFIGGFAATVGQFVLTASLRSQVNPKNTSTFSSLSPERALADYVFGTLVLHFFVYNYLG